MSYRYLDSNAALAASAAQWRRQRVLGIDTEFIRTRTFYPIPALYQLAAAGEVTLIDPTAIDEWRPFAELLEDPQVTIVMHSCSEDLEVFERHLGVAPSAIFDTQIANAFLSETFSMSYSGLVRRYLDVALEKEHTRSDWLQRPLSPEQLHYASEDVTYLEPLYRRLREELERLGRLAWFDAECATVTAPRPQSAESYYRGIRKAAQLDRRQLARLRRLVIWREHHVRERDLPRARFLADEVMLEIVQRERLAREPLRELLRHARARRKAGRKLPGLAGEILELIGEADRVPEASLPEPLEQPLTRADNALVKRLRDHAAAEAARLGMAPELLARRRDLELCLRCYRAEGRLSHTYNGWRYPLVGQGFERILAGQSKASQASEAPRQEEDREEGKGGTVTDGGPQPDER